jgi:hypothetical protein
VTSLIGYFPSEVGSSHLKPLNSYVTLRDMSRVRARVSFDIPSEYDPTLTPTASDDEPVCHVLMIAARLGIAIKPDDKDPTRYKRVGQLCIHKYDYYGQSYGPDDEEDLSITDFPDVQSIILV